MDAGPSLGKNLSVADISCNDNAAWKVDAHFDQPVQIFKRPGPDHDTLRSIAQQPIDRVPAPDAAPNLHFDVGRAEDGLNLGSIAATSCHRVEIDYVEVAKAVLSPGDGNSNGIRDADDLVVVGAGGKLHAGSASQIHCRNCDHRVRVAVRARIMRGESAATIAC